MLLALSATAAESTTLFTPPEQYNVVWTSPSERALDSMPCGGGNISLNVWTTSSELLFYIGSPDSWVDGNAPGKVAQVKLGRVRLRLSPNPFAGDFRQELDLATNSIRVSGLAEDGTTLRLRIWVDAFRAIVHIEGQASKPVNATVAVESWQKGTEGRFDDTSAVWHYRNEGPSLARTCRDRLCISPAESWQKKRPDYNSELPQMYPVFPFRIYGVGRPDLEIARNTWRYGFTDASKQKNYFCWFQGGIFTACLGLTDEAKEYALAKFLHPHYDFPHPEKPEESPWKLHWKLTEGWKVPRYPAFWDCMIFDARPDMDHGGSAMIQLQEMLMQTVDEKILLLPAWPDDWDVDFKLHAPSHTVVEVSVRNGKIISLNVIPESRREDVEILNGFEMIK